MSLLGNAQAFAALVGDPKAKNRKRALGERANALLSSFPDATPKSIAAAVAVLDKALQTADKDRALIRLVLGALVESGLSPELVWPAARRGFVDATEENMKSSAVLALACLLRSEDLRVSVQESEPEIIAACARFKMDIEEVLFLEQVAQILPDFTLLVIHPAQMRGFRVRVHEVTDNVELYVLLCDALVDTGKRGCIEGRRPSKKAIRVARDPDYETNEPVPVLVSFELAHWNGRIYLDQVPRDIPDYRGERVLLLGDRELASADRAIEGALEPLRPSVQVIQTLSAAEVEKQLLAMSRVSTSRARAGADPRAAAAARGARSPAARRKTRPA